MKVNTAVQCVRAYVMNSAYVRAFYKPNRYYQHLSTSKYLALSETLFVTLEVDKIADSLVGLTMFYRL